MNEIELFALDYKPHRIASHCGIVKFQQIPRKKKTPRNFQLFILQANLTEHRAGIASKSYYLCTIP